MMKGLLVCLIISGFFFNHSPVIAQSAYDSNLSGMFPSIADQSDFSSNILSYYLWPGDILIDDFQSWKPGDPDASRWHYLYDHYYNFPVGYYLNSLFKILFDPKLGSKVLDLSFPPLMNSHISISVSQQWISAYLCTLSITDDPDGESCIDIETHDTISFDFRLPLGMELPNPFELSILGTGKGEDVRIHILPLDPPDGTSVPDTGINHGIDGMTARVTDFEHNDSLEIEVYLGSKFLDGQWHTVWIDLSEVMDQALADAGLDPLNWGMEKAGVVRLGGYMYRVDNIIFRASPPRDIPHVPFFPHLLTIGPRCAQIFEPYCHLLFADYKTVDHPISSVYEFLLSDDPSNIFITDPDEIAGIWISEYGANPDLFGIAPDPEVSAIMGRDFVVDPELPIFANPDFRLGKNPALSYVPGSRKNPTFNWQAQTAGLHSIEDRAFEIAPLEIDPYDGMPTYIPVYYKVKEVMAQYGKTFFGPSECFHLESALWNAGFIYWPSIAKLDLKPETFSDFSLTITVSHGGASETETFPISVVNYPVDNYPPHIWGADHLRFYVGEEESHILGVMDPDCMIFSLAKNTITNHKPGTSDDFRKDMDAISWEVFSSDWFGFYCSPIRIENGLLNLVPEREGRAHVLVTARDHLGASDAAELNISCLRKSSYHNHPPIRLGGPTQPLTIRAGEELILQSPDFTVQDPDGDRIYASCNIGSCGQRGDGAFFWKFNTNFPGHYAVEIIFYDVYGGLAVMEFQLDVMPWWSY